MIWRIAGKGMIKSQAYRAWLEEAKWTYKASGLKPEMLEGEIRLQIWANISARRDVDNIPKPVGDLLQACMAFKNDRQVRDVRCKAVVNRDDIPKGHILVSWEEIE